MKFCLHYTGVLKSSDGAVGKHRIRQSFHSQVKSLCETEPFSISLDESRNEGSSAESSPRFIQHGERKYWFLISEHLATVVDLSITMLVPHEVGRIVHNGGDIDNRIKTLLDALRVPSVASEIPKTDNFDYSGGGMYCLLQDDKLIRSLSVQTFRDHDPLSHQTVRAILEVDTSITKALWGNLNFL